MHRLGLSRTLHLSFALENFGCRPLRRLHSIGHLLRNAMRWLRSRCSSMGRNTHRLWRRAVAPPRSWSRRWTPAVVFLVSQSTFPETRPRFLCDSPADQLTRPYPQPGRREAAVLTAQQARRDLWLRRRRRLRLRLWLRWWWWQRRPIQRHWGARRPQASHEVNDG